MEVRAGAMTFYLGLFREIQSGFTINLIVRKSVSFSVG